MSYLNITWVKEDPDEIIKYLIQAIADWGVSHRDIRVKADDLLKLQNRVNLAIKDYLKTDKRVKLPLIEKPADHIDWCKARIDRRLNFELV